MNTVERSSTKIKRSRSLHESKNRSQCVKNANSASTPNNPISGVKRSGSANRLCHKQPTPRDSEMPKKGYNAVMRPRRVSSNASEEQHSLDNGSSKENSVQGTPSDLSSPKVNTKLDFDALITPQPQKSGLPDDFEEMEALLMERDHLESQLAAERKQRTALEQAKVEHEEKQCRMQDQIKALEAEIIKVDGDMVHLRSRAEDADKLADQKRALEARLIAARGAKREMDTISICSIDDDLISLSGMSIYQENGLMLNEDIHQLNKTELVQNLIAVKKEKKDLEANLKQLRCDMANEKRRHEKTVKDLMVQVRGIHMPGPPVINTEPDSQPAQPAVAEYERQLTELRTQLEAAEVHKKAQSKLVERLIGERNHHLIELARLRGDGEEATQLREEVSKLRRQISEKDTIILTKLNTSHHPKPVTMGPARGTLI